MFLIIYLMEQIRFKKSIIILIFCFGKKRMNGISPYKNLMVYKSYQYINQIRT